MPQLLDLPNELLYILMDFVRPDVLVNIALASHFFFDLAKDRLEEHRTFRRSYTTICRKNSNSQAFGLINLLEDVLLDPRKAYYIKNLECRDLFRRFGGEITTLHHERVANPRYQDNVMSLFKDAARDTMLIPPDCKFKWEKAIHGGREDTIIGLLFTRLHHLRKLTMRLDMSFQGPFYQMLNFIHEAGGSRHFPVLESVSLLGDTARKPLSLLSCFAQIPSVKRIHCERLDQAVKVHGFTFDLQPHTSNVEVLSLRECAFTASALGCVLRATRALKSFRYENCRQDDFNLTGTVELLRDYCKNTLETLTIRPHFSAETCSAHFLDFQQLKVLEIDFNFGLPGKTKIADVLPASIECVYIHKYMMLRQEYVSRLLKDLLAVKAVRVPKLRQLGFVEMSRGKSSWVRRISKLEKKARKAGLILTIEYIE